MEDVQFDEGRESLVLPRQTTAHKEAGLIGFLIKHQYAKTRQQAQIILLVVAAIAFIASIIIFMNSGVEPSSTPPPLT